MTSQVFVYFFLSKQSLSEFAPQITLTSLIPHSKSPRIFKACFFSRETVFHILCTIRRSGLTMENLPIDPAHADSRTERMALIDVQLDDIKRFTEEPDCTEEELQTISIHLAVMMAKVQKVTSTSN